MNESEEKGLTPNKGQAQPKRVSDPSSAEFVFKFLHDVRLEGIDDDEIENVSRLLATVQAVHPESKIELPLAIPTALQDDEDLWHRLERVAKFVSRLRNRRGMNEIDCANLKFIGTLLLKPLNERVSDQPPYKYKPLVYRPRDSTAEIRILHLVSGGDGQLRCRIEHVDLPSAQFIALSYEWGEPQMVFWINVIDASGGDLGSIPLNNNAHSALCNLRDSDAVTMKTFWIDQISINQEDTLERGHQVNMMRKIYEKASRVVSYLGPSETFDREGIQLLNHIHEQFNHFYEDIHFTRQITYYRRRFRDPENIPQRLLFHNNFPKSAWKSLWRLIFGPWTRRLWMLQETSVNRTEVLMLRGVHSFPWMMLAAVDMLRHVNLLPDFGDLADFGYAKQFQILTVQWCWVYRILNPELRGGFPLHQMLHFFSTSMECHDPKDRLYALLGLANDSVELGIEVDYSKTYEDVLLDLSVRMLSRQDGLVPLSHRSGSHLAKVSSLPSWVTGLGISAVSNLSDCMTAGDWGGKPSFSLDHNILRIQGIYIAPVMETSAPLPELSIQASSLPQLAGMTEAIDMAREHLAARQEGAPDSVISRTLIGRSTWPEADEDCSRAINWLFHLGAFTTEYFQDNPKAPNLRLLWGKNRIQKDEEERSVETFIQHEKTMGRALCFTNDHQICLAPRYVEKGDVIVILRGGPSLYVLRPVGERYKYVGDAFMIGLMDGEGTREPGWEEKITEFSIV